MRPGPRSVVRLAVALLSASLLSGCSAVEHTMPPSATDVAGAVLTAGASAAPTSSVTPSPTPTVAVPATAPTPPVVPGYTLAPASATVVRKFQTVTGKFNGVFSGLTVRTVTKGNVLTGTVVLLGLHPELVGNTTVERNLLPGMAKGMAGQGARTSTQKIGAQDVAIASTKTTNIVAWYRDGTVVLVLGSGTDAAPTLAFAKAYLVTR